jgi:hypothetical protein
MGSTTIRVSVGTHQTLKQLSSSTDLTMQQVLESALEMYRRRVLLEQAVAAYARLEANPELYRDWQNELAQWDATLADGLDEPQSDHR